MIKKILFAVMLAIPAMGFAQKFGVINTETLMSDMPEMTEVRTQLENVSKNYEAEFKKLQDEFQTKFDEFQKMGEDTPQSIKERRAQELNELDQRTRQFQQTAQQEIQRQSEQLMAPVRQKVMAAIQSVGAEGSYVFIFELGQPIYVGADVTDVTNAVKAKLGIK